MNIEDIVDPSFLKELSYEELDELANDIRKYILDSVSENGGHLSSNLGVVELVIAMHRAFDAPKDKLLFDVGHQTYTHKILTGRGKKLKEELRKHNGLSGYQKLCESEYDCMEAGHSSTALSIANGMAYARDLNNEDYNVVALVGDASIVSGLSLEALNSLGNQKNKVIVILNDNQMSISKPTGGIHKVFNRLRASHKYQNGKNSLRRHLTSSWIRKIILKYTSKLKNSFKAIFIKNNIFDDLNLEYLGPYDGYNIKSLVKVFEEAKKMECSVVIHVQTTKGKGYKLAEEDKKGYWHGVGPFDLKTGLAKEAKDDRKVSYSKVIADALHQKMQENEDIIAITPAMITGSKLEEVFKDFPKRSIDVGINEEHGVTLASGLGLAKKLPFISIYSTFMQRAYDNLNHDVARMNLPLVVGVDRAGLVGEDGDTHHGMYDVEITKGLPGSIIAMPYDYSDAFNLVDLAFKTKKLFFIRYPREEEFISEVVKGELEVGKWDLIKESESKLLIISTGPVSKYVKEMLEKENLNASLIFARFYKPLDEKLLLEKLAKIDKVIIYDIYATKNALYSDVCSFIIEHNLKVEIKKFCLPNENVTFGKISELYEDLNITLEDLKKEILCA